MRKRFILDPFWVIFGLFALQALLWWFFMPQVPTIFGAASRYRGDSALLRFLLLWMALLAGVSIGKMAGVTWQKRTNNQSDHLSTGWVKFLSSFAAYTLLISLAGELVYVREIIANPALIREAFDAGTLALVGEQVNEVRIVGFSSLNNLFIIPSAIYAMIMFHPDMGPVAVKKARFRLILIGTISVLHALIFAARMFPVYFVLIVFAAYLLVMPNSHRLTWRNILKTVGFMGAIIWVGELLRGGLWYATNYGVGVFSAETQRHVIDLFVQGYFAADFNNALVLLDHNSSYQFFSTTMLGEFLSGFDSYTLIHGWTSAFGTVNVLGLWWYDWGLWAYGLSLIVGALLGVAYKVAEKASGRISLVTLCFVIAYPGIWSLTRINYFFLTIFVIPVAFIAVAGILVSLLRLRQAGFTGRNVVMGGDNFEGPPSHAGVG